MIALEEIREKQEELKNAICSSITKFMEKHNCKELDVTDFDDTPIILEDLERSDFTYTLDRLTNYNDVRVYCSNREDDDSFYLTSLGIDILTDLYEWLLENEEFMEFNND